MDNSLPFDEKQFMKQQTLKRRMRKKRMQLAMGMNAKNIISPTTCIKDKMQIGVFDSSSDTDNSSVNLIADDKFAEKFDIFQTRRRSSIKKPAGTQKSKLQPLINLKPANKHEALDTEMMKIWDDPLNYGEPLPKLKKFKTKYTEEEVHSKDLPPNQRHVRLALEDNEYMKLFMQNNPVHDNDHEKAASIAQNISYNQDVVNKNPYFGRVNFQENKIYLSK